MKFKHKETLTIPVLEQFQKNWQSIVYDWLQKNHQSYPDAIVEEISPNINYYRRSDGESMMEGSVDIAIVTYKNITDPNFDF